MRVSTPFLRAALVSLVPLVLTVSLGLGLAVAASPRSAAAATADATPAVPAASSAASTAAPAASPVAASVPAPAQRASEPASAGVGVGPSGIPFDRARAVLDDVLAHGDFEREQPASWTADLKRWILQRLASLFERLGGTHVPTESIGRMLAWGLAAAALAAMAVWLFRSRWPSLPARLIDAAAPRLSSREWAARASTALRAGDAREAMRCAYHAALFQLEEQGVWLVDDARTPREYLSLLPAGDSRRAALATLTRDFELTWYGSRAADVTGLLERLEVFGCPAPPDPAI